MERVFGYVFEMCEELLHNCCTNEILCCNIVHFERNLSDLSL
jgi:hypothetical protein